MTETEEEVAKNKKKSKDKNKDVKNKGASALLRLPMSPKRNGYPSTLPVKKGKDKKKNQTSLADDSAVTDEDGKLESTADEEDFPACGTFGMDNIISGDIIGGDEDNAVVEKEETDDAKPVAVEEPAVRKQKRLRRIRFGFPAKSTTRSEPPAVNNTSIDDTPVVADTTTNNKPEKAKKSKAEKEEEKKKIQATKKMELEILAKLEAAEKKIMELETKKTIEAQKRGELQAEKEEKEERHATKELDDILQAMVSNDEHDVSLTHTTSTVSTSSLARATSFGSTAMKKAKLAAKQKKDAIAAKKEAGKAKLAQKMEDLKEKKELAAIKREYIEY